MTSPTASLHYTDKWELQVLVSAAETLAARLYEFSTDRFGSHVARALVGLAAGVDLQNLQGGSKDAPSKMQRAVCFLSNLQAEAGTLVVINY